MATKSAISFGLVHIPIALHTATQDNDIHFNQLHKTDHQRVRYKKTCGHCGQEIMERTPGGGLRQPVFKGLRDDKTPKECVH